MTSLPGSFLYILPLISFASALHSHLPASISSTGLRLATRASSSTKQNNAVGNVVDITAPRDVSSLGEWASNWGVQAADCFQLDSDNDADVYAITNQDLPENSPVLYIPNELILTGSKARLEMGEMSYGAEQMLMNSEASNRISQFYLFLKVLKEYELGEESVYLPWLNSLPRFFSNGASMTDFCYGCLPPYAAEVSLTEKRSLRHFVEALREVPFLSSESKSNQELTTWAFSVVHTRYFTMPGGDMCIVPLADFFNHHGSEDVSISYDDNGNCYAYSTRDVPAGQPLRICYGDPTNPSNLLARYGFLDESSPATFCKFTIKNPSQEHINMGYDESRMLFYNDGSISQEVWDVLLFQELAQVSPDDQQLFYNAHMNNDEALKRKYHELYFPQTLSALRNHVDFLLNELEELGMGLETQMDQGLDPWRYPRLDLILRHNEFVKNTFELVQQNLHNMSS
ncbi:unnamed protein product [Cylindrotheca closterium]|uniref:SET domain-containing protein n=1 Tax=Cylindrotheca closterium TaxID=2856 RepID=A0AAD2CU56_9STRA|nr:unnamed protein product [Cylindrotheca closterium]